MTPKHCLDSLSILSIHRGTLILAASLLAGASAPAQQTTERASVSSSENQGNGESLDPSLSEDGRYVAFQSEASNLILGDFNGVQDIFVRDSQTGSTKGITATLFGAQGNGLSQAPAISGDGRFVAFDSLASNLVPGDTNGTGDVFIFDGLFVTIVRVSVDSFGNQGTNDSRYAATSDDGRYVAFSSLASNLVPGDTNGKQDVFVHDVQTGTTERVSVDSFGNQANAFSLKPSISTDGRYVAYRSAANLGTANNGEQDVFVHDRQTGTTECVSVDSSGNETNGWSGEPTISGDGRYVAFCSEASNLVPGDTNGFRDIFVHDRQTGVTERVSIDSSGNQGNNISGYYVDSSSISADGRYVAFDSDASNLVPGDTNGSVDIFVHDRQTGVTERASVDSSGNEGNSASSGPSISGDGHFMAFNSLATNLVAGDTNGFIDVFVRDRSCTDAFASYCTAGISASGCAVHLSSTGVASGTAAAGFVVTANLVEGQKDGQFLYGQNGKQALPWGNGTSFQCVVPPVKRGGLQQGNGTLGACNSVISQDLNAYWCATCPKPNHAPIPGKPLQIQFWYRDPLSTSNQTKSFSDAIEVLPCP